MTKDEALLEALTDLCEELLEGYTDVRFNPDTMAKKDFKKHKDISYGEVNHGKGGDASRDVLATTSDGKTYKTDLGNSGRIGGAVRKGTGQKKDTYSPSWGHGHDKVKKTLNNIDKEVKAIRKS